MAGTHARTRAHVHARTHAGGVLYFAGLLPETLVLVVYVRSHAAAGISRRIVATQLLLVASTLLRAVWFILRSHDTNTAFYGKHFGCMHA